MGTGYCMLGLGNQVCYYALGTRGLVCVPGAGHWAPGRPEADLREAGGRLKGGRRPTYWGVWGGGAPPQEEKEGKLDVTLDTSLRPLTYRQSRISGWNIYKYLAEPGE